VVIERRRQLNVDVVWESKSGACLPRQHERIRRRNFLACLITVARTDHWIRPYRILGILIVIDELGSVHEDVELQFERFRWRSYNGLAFLAVSFLAVGLNRFAASAADIEGKCVLPLLGEAFGIDVVIPEHRRGNERLRHSSARKLEVRDPGVTE